MDIEASRSAIGGAVPPLSRTREVLLVSVLCCTQLLTQASLGQVLVPLHHIGQAFGVTSTGQLSWFVAAYSLTVGTFVLVAGRLGDIYGHKRLLVGGWLWFGLWSLLAGLSVYAASPIFFDVCRAMQGIGPAFLIANGLAIGGTTYPPGKKRDMVFALFAATAPLGFLIGAVSGSLFAQYAWWPWMFWSTAIIHVALSGLAHVVVPAESQVHRDKNQQFDLYGAVLGVLGMVLLNFSWNQAPLVGWSTPYVYSVLIVGLIFLVVFALYEHKLEQPLLPPDIFNKGAISIMVCLGLGWSSFGIWIYYTFQIIERLRNVSPLLASAQYIPEAISAVCAALATAYLVRRIAARWLMVLASIAFCVGCILSATAPVEQSYWANTFASMIVIAWGMDLSFPASAISLSNMVPKERQGISASLVNTIINYSVSIGLGIAGTVESVVIGQGQDELQGYRSALYTSVGLAGLSLCVSAAFAIQGSYDLKRPQKIIEGSRNISNEK